VKDAARDPRMAMKEPNGPARGAEKSRSFLASFQESRWEVNLDRWLRS